MNDNPPPLMDGNCRKQLWMLGKPAPRTCEVCGLGPCQQAILEYTGDRPPPVPSDPPLLRVPTHFHSVSDVLACAAKMDLPNVLVLSERADGSLVFLDNDLTLAQANWLLDRMKALLITPNQFERREGTPAA
jgi:hypothetical protein